MLSSRLLSLAGANIESVKSKEISTPKQQNRYKWDIVWLNVIGFIYLYFSAIYGLYLAITAAKWKTLLWCLFLLFCGTLGHTAGSHRLWSHRTYKANLPLRILLALFATVCYQNHIYEWVRDHRVHHKYTDTDADPHNSARGFFFSHVGWLMVKKHKDIAAKGKSVDLSDLEQDPVVMYQKMYYPILMPLFCFILPPLVSWYFWNESGWVSYYVVGIARYMLNVNGTWLVNSAAHIYGMRPYDKNIRARENTFVGYIGLGEGWHNYHHTFPWDYKASELGDYAPNLTKAFIDFFAWLGWAYDLKTASPDLVKQRIFRTGEGTKLLLNSEDECDKTSLPSGNIWGWGDVNMRPEDIRYVKRFNIKG